MDASASVFVWRQYVVIFSSYVATTIHPTFFSWFDSSYWIH
uniref:Uncharacterized protein n=1 Tax=Escherichia phage ETEP102 TaxID=3117680 RepID=A0AAU6PXI0_9CAUD